MRNANREDVAKLIEFGRTLPHSQSAGDLFSHLLAAALELAVKYEPDPAVTVEEVTKAVHIVYRARRPAVIS